MFTTRSVRLEEVLVRKLTERFWKFGSFLVNIRVEVIRDQLYSLKWFEDVHLKLAHDRARICR